MRDFLPVSSISLQATFHPQTQCLAYKQIAMTILLIFFKVLMLLSLGIFDDPEIIRMSTLGRQPVVLGGLYSGKILFKIFHYLGF